MPGTCLCEVLQRSVTYDGETHVVKNLTEIARGEFLTMSDRIAVFNDGVIQQLATPAELFEQPQNTFVAQFIGKQLSGKVVALNGATCKVEIPGSDKVEARAINVEAVDRPTVLRIKLNPPPGSLPNVFSALVTELIYLGDHVRTRDSVCGHDDFVVKLPNSEGVAQLARGETITIGWDRGLSGGRSVVTITPVCAPDDSALRSLSRVKNDAIKI